MFDAGGMDADCVRTSTAYALSVPNVVGRDPELDRIEEFLRDGTVGALAMLGEPGIGKTTVWEEATVRAKSRGAIVLVARPAESEAQLSFGGLADLVSKIPEKLLRELPPPQRDALDAALLRTSSAQPPRQQLVATAFLSLLQALAREAPVVLAIDDLHWLDKPSAAVLQFVVRRIRDQPVRLIVSARSAEQAAALAGIERDVPLERVALGPLSVAALHRVFADVLDRTFSRPVIVRIAEASGGNPLYALEIARQLDHDVEHVSVSRLPVPTDVLELVRERVRKLPERTRDALLQAASLARPDTTTIDAGDLAPAEEDGLVSIDADGRIRFRHPLFASAVYSSAALARRRDVHRALAEVVADPIERARHLALGSAEGDLVVLDHLERATHHARMRGAPDTAAELTELALRLVPPDTPRALELRLELAEHLFFASDFEGARRIADASRTAFTDGDLRARALLLLADIDYWRVGESAAVALAEDALAVAVEPLVRARCQTSVAMYSGTVDLAKAGRAAAAALELLEEQPRAEPGLMAAALAARIRADLFLGEGFDAEAAERALALESAAPPLAVDDRVAFKLGQWLRYVDDFEGARTQLVLCEQQAREEGDESSLTNILLNRLILETWAGQWIAADDLAERLVVAFEQQGVVPGDAGLWRAYVDAHFGRLEAVRAAAERGAQREPIIAAIWSRSVGLAELAAGDPDAAYSHLSSAMETLDSVDFREPGVWRVDGDAIEAAIESGARDSATRWLRRFRQRAARSRIPWSLAVSARCQGLVLAAEGKLEEAYEALERSLHEHDGCPMPFERARTLLVRGRVLRRLKRKRDARTSLEDAREIFAQLGSDAWVARADAELLRVRTRRAPDQLSETELRIAEFAAGGLSNAEIASRMFVSRKTVEANLGRAYRKLGISSRAELHAALQRDAESLRSG